MNTLYGEWTQCKDCAYFDDCDEKENKDGCYFGEPKFPRGKRAELNVYDDAMEVDMQRVTLTLCYSVDKPNMINKCHKDQDGVTVIDDFRVMGMSVVEDDI